MTSLQSLRRSLLDRIWKEVTDSNFEQRLQQDDVVPSEVLSANGIIILGFDIEKADAPENSPHDSPILFKPAPRDFFQRNHIDLNGFESSRDRDHYYSLHKYRPSDGNEWLREEFWPKEFSRVVADYLEHWAFRDFPRKLEDSILPHLPDNFGIRKPSYPGGLYAGGKFDGRRWSADVFEYEEKPNGSPYPHVLMLSCQRNIAHEKSIMRGELALILTAMRNRAFQKVEEDLEDDDSDEEFDDDDGDDDDDFDDDDQEEETEEEEKAPKFLFENEKRFPVLVISCVGPQHARVLHAVMDGFNVVVRQSRIYSFEQRDVDVLDIFSTHFLSRPIEEVQVARRRYQPTPGAENTRPTSFHILTTAL